MTGMLRVRAAATADGDKQIMTILPNGARFFLPTDAAMSYAFAVLAVAKNLIPQDRLDASVTAAYDHHRELMISDGRVQ
jgi:hypothetical protein